ncbi:MAG: hypothetical protein AB7J30_02865 [Hyphomicrobium sp.]
MSRIALTCGLVVLSLVATMTPAARATIQDESCIYPDVEYPIPCDDDED